MTEKQLLTTKLIIDNNGLCNLPNVHCVDCLMNPHCSDKETLFDREARAEKYRELKIKFFKDKLEEHEKLEFLEKLSC